MASDSESSQVDYDRLSARVRHTARHSSPESEPTRTTDLIEVGGQFGENRRDSYPDSLQLSENEQNDLQPDPHTETRPLTNALPGGGSHSSSPSSSPLPPRTPMQTRFGPYIHSSEFLPRSRSARQNGWRGRDQFYQRSQTSGDESTEENSRSDLTIGNSPPRQRNGQVNRRSATPTPAFSPSRTPSHHSRDTDEDRERVREPQSPHPFSAYNPYNADRGRTALDGFDEQFSRQE